MKRILAPEYIEKFSCTGSLCKETCCARWNIDVDQTTYNQYMQIEESFWKERMKQSVMKRKKNSTDKQYAYMNMSDSLSCPFLNDDKLCDIHGQLGEEYLCGTCATFPRTLNKTNDNLELSLMISCPEAAKLILLNPEPMEFVEKEMSIHPKASMMDFSNVQHKEPPHFWDIRVATINILQNRNYSLEDRFIIIGLMCQKIDQLIENGQAEHIPLVTAEYISNAEKGVFQQSLSEIHGERGMKFHLLNNIFSTRLSSMTRSPIYNDLSPKFVRGLIKNGDELSDMIDNYHALYHEKYLPLMEEKEYILENYFVNHIFARLVPSRYYEALSSIVQTACLYILLKIQLIGLLGNDEEMNDEMIIDLLFSFNRTFGVDIAFHDSLAKYIEKENLKELSNLAMLMKE